MEETLLFEGVNGLSESDIPAFVNAEILEFAPSMEVQANEISDVFYDIPGLQFENWEHLDVNERIDALQQLENYAAEIAHRPAINISADTLESGVLGYYNHGSQSIVISSEILADNSMYRNTLETVIHEGRHAYQYYNLYSGNVVEQNTELVDAWRVNLDVLGYESGDNLIFRTLGMCRYYTQPIEVDARAFANEVMRAMGV